MLKKLIIREKIMAMVYGGIMYSSLNMNSFEDAPIESVKAKFGSVGEAAVMKLLCKMYKEEEYYLLWGEEQCTLLSHKTGIEKGRMEGIINVLMKEDFFDKRCYEGRHVLTSAEIQKTWLGTTKRRKRESTSLPYLLIEKGSDTRTEADHRPEKEDGYVQDQKSHMQFTNISSGNADNSEQSKVGRSIAVKEEESPVRSLFLTPPGYAHNRQTHNYDGLMLTLQRMRIVNPEGVNAILRLSDCGKLRGYVWQVVYSARWGEIVARGKYLIVALVKKKKKSGC